MNMDHPDTALEARFIDAVRSLAESFGWQPRSFMRGDEIVALAALDGDADFEQLVWVFDAVDATLRCILVSRASVAPAREAAVLELCARINSGLVFGCAEYSFEDRVVVFRDSADLRHGAATEHVRAASERLLGLGSRYAAAIRATLSGASPQAAVAGVEAP